MKYQSSHITDGIIIKLQAAQNLCCQFFANLSMPIKMIDSIGICSLRLWFSYIMEQHAQTQYLVRFHILQSVCNMLTHRIHMMRIVLHTCHTCIKLRQHYTGDAQLPGFQDPVRMWGHQHLHQLCLDPLSTDFSKIFTQFFYSFAGLFFQFKSKLSTKPYRTHHTQRIFSKTCFRITHAANDPTFQIPCSVKLINQSFRRIVGHGIDRKIPALQILQQTLGKLHFLGMTAILILSIHPVSGHLKSFFSQHNRHRSMLNPGIDGSGKQCLYLIGRCGCGNIPVCRFSSQQCIAHTAADCIGFMPCRSQSIYNIFNFFRNVNFIHSDSL